MIFSQCLELFIATSLAYYLPLLAIDFIFKEKKALACISFAMGLIVLMCVFKLPIVNSKNTYDVTVTLIVSLLSLIIVNGIKLNVFKEQYKRLFKKIK